MQIVLYSILGFCATAGAIGLTHVLMRFLHRGETFYTERDGDG